MGAPEEDRRRLRELNVLAAGHCAAGRYEAAVPLFEQVVAGCTAGFGADDPDTLIGHGNLVVTQLRLDPRGSALSGLDALFSGLTAFAWVSLLVSGFVVYNTFSMIVLQRVREINHAADC